MEGREEIQLVFGPHSEKQIPERIFYRICGFILFALGTGASLRFGLMNKTDKNLFNLCSAVIAPAQKFQGVLGKRLILLQFLLILIKCGR